jgi:membrane-associated phospholipid phosphatase
METFLQLDQSLFDLLNGQWRANWLDAIMPIWREKKTWIPLYLALAALSIYRFKLKGLYLILALGLAVGLADTISSKVIKPAVHRLRPCNDPALKEEVKLLVHCGSGYSFTSSHASNHFAVAAFLSLTLGFFYRWMRWPLHLWAASIAWGQVYVGVHYPFDVICGAFLGLLIGNIVAKSYLRVSKLIPPTA